MSNAIINQVVISQKIHINALDNIVNMDKASKLDKEQFRDKYGKVDDKIPVPSDVKSDVSTAINELEKEDNIPNNINFGQGLEILLERADSLKDMRESSDIRATLKKNSK